MSQRRYIVFGAGAIGGILGARLHASGHEVVLVARGAHYEAIRAHGLRLKAPDGTESVHAIAAVDRVAAARPVPGDAVMLCVKSQDSEAALRELAGAAATGIAVFCVQNGIENERLALRRFSHVYGVVVMCPGMHIEPGLVEMGAAPNPGILDLGRYPAGTDAIAEEVVADLRAAGYLSEARDEILPWKAAKLLNNVTNALVALAGAEARGSELASELRAEAETVFRAAGLPVVSEAAWTARSELLQRLPEGRSGNSSWQSLERGTRSIETDFLNGEVALLARQTGTPAPLNVLVQQMARELAASGAPPGSVPLELIVARLAA